MAIENGIILAGGTGSRLAPLTSLFNKHMVPVYNKFIIDYPVETIKNIGTFTKIKNLTIVLGGDHFSQVVSHLQDGEKFGLNINYVYQSKPIGIAQGINLCEPFIKDEFVVVLGDNIFEKPIKFIEDDSSHTTRPPGGAQIVLHKHPELHRFGVASVDRQTKKIAHIVEKPKVIDSEYDNFAITGCYKFDRKFFEYFKKLKPSARGEYEITDVIDCYNADNTLDYTFVNGLWSDAGTHESINFVNNFFYYKGKSL